jgi:hypothetical protein
MVGQWASVDKLLATEELEEKLRKGWSRKGKGKGKAVGDTADDAIQVDED